MLYLVIFSGLWTHFLLALASGEIQLYRNCMFVSSWPSPYHLASTGTGRSFGRLPRAPRPFAMAATSSWQRGRRWHRCAQQIRRQASYPKDLVSAWQEWQKWAHKWRNEKQAAGLAGGSGRQLQPAVFFGRFSCTVYNYTRVMPLCRSCWSLVGAVFLHEGYLSDRNHFGWFLDAMRRTAWTNPAPKSVRSWELEWMDSGRWLKNMIRPAPRCT